MKPERPAVMFVHGLPLGRNPARGWVAYCRPAVLQARAEPLSFAYSRWTGMAALLRPHGNAAARLAREFREAYNRTLEVHGPPAIIAHSLGSYLVARALAEHAGEVTFRGVILFGSIVRADYDWVRIIERGQVPVRRLRNEVGLHDWPLRWAQLLGRMGFPYGPAGTEGFRRRPGLPSIDRPYIGAGDARGLARYCRDVWLPFLGFHAAGAMGGHGEAGATRATASARVGRRASVIVS